MVEIEIPLVRAQLSHMRTCPFVASITTSSITSLCPLPSISASVPQRYVLGKCCLAPMSRLPTLKRRYSLLIGAAIPPLSPLKVMPGAEASRDARKRSRSPCVFFSSVRRLCGCTEPISTPEREGSYRYTQHYSLPFPPLPLCDSFPSTWYHGSWRPYRTPLHLKPPRVYPGGRTVYLGYIQLEAFVHPTFLTQCLHPLVHLAWRLQVHVPLHF